MGNAKTIMLLAALTALFMGAGYMIGGASGAMIALVVSAGMNLFAIWNADRMILRMHNARAVDAETAPELYRIVGTLAARAGLPMPGVYLIDTDAPNAFATGRSPERAAVAATTGLLKMLDRDEVEAVMAHELGHVRNRDTLLMTVTATLGGAISMLGNFAMFAGRGESRSPVALILAMVVAPFAAMLVQMAISRTREYGADRAGAEISGKPMALASALRKLALGAARIPNPYAAQNPAAAQLYIVEPRIGGGMDNLFSTHPDPENRIAALADIAREMGTNAVATPRVSALDPLGRR